jgi:hypothetical protein
MLGKRQTKLGIQRQGKFIKGTVLCLSSSILIEALFSDVIVVLRMPMRCLLMMQKMYFLNTRFWGFCSSFLAFLSMGYGCKQPLKTQTRRK